MPRRLGKRVGYTDYKKLDVHATSLPLTRHVASVCFVELVVWVNKRGGKSKGVVKV